MHVTLPSFEPALLFWWYNHYELMHAPYLFVWELCFLTVKKLYIDTPYLCGMKHLMILRLFPLNLAPVYSLWLLCLDQCVVKTWSLLLLHHRLQPFPGWSSLLHSISSPPNAFPLPPLHTHAWTHTHLVLPCQKTKDVLKHSKNFAFGFFMLFYHAVGLRQRQGTK